MASRSLTGGLEWQNSRLVEGSLEDTVTELKQQDGGEIAERQREGVGVRVAFSFSVLVPQRF